MTKSSKNVMIVMFNIIRMCCCTIISGGNIMKTEIKYDKEIETFHLPRWNELPNVDLYLDQVVTLLENYLSNYIRIRLSTFTTFYHDIII